MRKNVMSRVLAMFMCVVILFLLVMWSATMYVQASWLSNLTNAVKSTAETMWSFLNSMGVHVKEMGQEVVDFALDIYNKLSPSNKAIVDDVTAHRVGGGLRDRGNPGRVGGGLRSDGSEDVGITLPEYEAVKENVQNYISNNYIYTCCMIFPAFPDDKSKPVKQLNFNDYSGIFYFTECATIEKAEILSGYCRVRSTKSQSYMLKNGQWEKTVYYEAVNTLYSYNSEKGIHEHTLYYSSVPVYYQNNAIFIPAGWNCGHHKTAETVLNDVYIDNRVYNTTTIEQNWQTINNYYSNPTYQYINIYNIGDYGGKTIENVLSFTIVNNYETIINYYPPEEPVKPGEQINYTSWFQQIVNKLGNISDEIKNMRTAIVTAITGKETVVNVENIINVDGTEIILPESPDYSPWYQQIVNRLADITEEIKNIRNAIAAAITGKETVVNVENIINVDGTEIILPEQPDYSPWYQQIVNRLGDIADEINNMRNALVTVITGKETVVNVENIINVDGTEIVFPEPPTEDERQNFLVRLFVPEAGAVESSVAELKQTFDRKFGAFNQFGAAANQFITALQSRASDGAPVFEVEYNGQKMTVIDLTMFDDYMAYIRGIIVGLLWVGFVIRTYRRLPKIIGGDTS